MSDEDLKQENARLKSAINQFLDVCEMPWDCAADIEASVKARHKAIAAMHEAVGRTVKRPDFEDDDITYHVGITPEEAEADWLEVWGKVAEPSKVK